MRDTGIGLQDSPFRGSPKETLAGKGMQTVEKERDAASASIEIGTQRTMGHFPGAVKLLHGIAKPVATIAGPDCVATDPGADTAGGFEVLVTRGNHRRRRN